MSKEPGAKTSSLFFPKKLLTVNRALRSNRLCRMKYARFDGDFSHQISSDQLRLFKTDPSVRVLLATVVSIFGSFVAVRGTRF